VRIWKPGKGLGKNVGFSGTGLLVSFHILHLMLMKQSLLVKVVFNMKFCKTLGWRPYK
jgi:hypothetical protein